MMSPVELRGKFARGDNSAGQQNWLIWPVESIQHAYHHEFVISRDECDKGIPRQIPKRHKLSIFSVQSVIALFRLHDFTFQRRNIRERSLIVGFPDSRQRRR